MIRLLSNKRIIYGFPTIKNIIYRPFAANQCRDDGLASFNFKNYDIDFSSEFKLARSLYPSIVEDVLNEQLHYHGHLPELKERSRRMIDYTVNLKDAYLTTSAMLINSYKLFEKPSLLTEDNITRAAVLGWCLRLQESSLIMMDDITDNSKMRYNKPTWYSLPDVGVKTAMYDAAFLETSALILFLKHFDFHPQQVNIQRVLLRNHSTCCLSFLSEMPRFKFNQFEKYESVSKFYPLIVPSVFSAMYMANIVDQYLQAKAFDILHDISRFVKTEDDVNSVFGKTEEDCTDESEGRPTWMAIQVYKYGSHEQRKVFEDNYGKDDGECISKIYDVYTEMGLKDKFYEYRKMFYKNTYRKIEALPKELPQTPFLNSLKFAVAGKMMS